MRTLLLASSRSQGPPLEGDVGSLTEVDPTPPVSLRRRPTPPVSLRRRSHSARAHPTMGRLSDKTHNRHPHQSQPVRLMSVPPQKYPGTRGFV